MRIVTKLFLLLSLLTFSCDAQVVPTPIMNGSGGIVTNASGSMVAPNQTAVLPSNPLFVLFDIGQSNSVGRAERDRIVQLTKYPEIPSKILIYYKPDYTATDNGTWHVLQHGATATKEPDQVAGNLSTGSYGQLAGWMTGYTGDTTYVVMMGDGGTALNAGTTDPDWAPATNDECFETATANYYAVAYSKIQTLNPGRNIVPIIMWHQGESDALNSTATANYSTNFPAFVTAVRASHSSLADALWITTKLWYQASANEATINAVFDSYAATHPNFKVINISDQPRKIELTAGQKGGISPTGILADDIHTSYLGQNAKAERAWAEVVNYYNITSGFDEVIDNTNYDPSVLSANGYRLQMNRSNTTFGSTFTVSSFANDLATGTFSSVTGSVKFKVDGKKGAVTPLVASSSRVNSTAAIGTSLVSPGNFSIGAWLKPRDGQTAANQYVFHDIQNTGTPGNSRFALLIETTGKVIAFVSISGTTRTAKTANVIFPNGLQKGETHVAATFTNGDQIRIYINGVLQSLDVTDSGSLSGINLTSYVNNTNAHTLFARKTGASTYDLFYVGLCREAMIQPVVWSGANILSIMSN